MSWDERPNEPHEPTPSNPLLIGLGLALLITLTLLVVC